MKDQEILEVRKQINAAKQEELDKNKRLEDERAAKLSALTDRQASLRKQLRHSDPRFTASDELAELRSEIASLRHQREEAKGDEHRAIEIENAILQKQIRLREILNRQLANERAARRAAAKQISVVRKAEAEYAFSELSPEQQLAAIHARAREIMSKKGWEKDAQARAELLDLRKRRDEIEANKKKPDAGEKAAKSSLVESEWSIKDIFEAYYARRARGDDVIRMHGSRAGGFIGEDGVRRMTGSLAGGFSSRLRPTAFARSAAELEAKRKGIAEAGSQLVASTGEEQPVELKGEAVNYLRAIAGVLGKEA